MRLGGAEAYFVASSGARLAIIGWEAFVDNNTRTAKGRYDSAGAGREN